MDFSKVEFPHVSVPHLEIPKIKIPEIDIPEIDIPQLNIPRLNIPRLNIPQVDIPQVDLPDALGSLSTFASQLQLTTTAALSHPIWTIGIVIVSIGLIQLLADLVKRVIKASISLVLTSPLILSRWIWKRVTAASTPKVDSATRITQLLTQLDILRAEQDQVIKELKDLLQSTPAATKATSKEATSKEAPGSEATINEAAASKAISHSASRATQPPLPANSATPPLQTSAESPQS